MSRLAAALLPCLLLSPASAAAPAAAQPPWKPALARLAAGRDALSRRLEEVHGALLARVRAEKPQLLGRLEPSSPKPLPTGYGILPPMEPDGPESGAAAPVERRYDLPGLAGWEGGEKASIEALSVRLSSSGSDLAPLVDEYLLRAENLRRIDQTVKYHELWQAQGSAAAVSGTREALEAFRLWRSTPADEAGARRVAEARDLLSRVSTGFSSVPWHHIERAPDGLLLKVPFKTDIEDGVFLSTLSAAVERFWNSSPAMREAGLRIALSWDRVPASKLYPEGAPKPGAPVDLSAHLTRFGPGYVLTTGAATMHLLGGRGIMLGPYPVRGRGISHEVAHILGFGDGYIRAYEGSPGAPDGYVIWELTPFPQDLMSDPGGGRVTPAMVQRLLDAYLPR